MESIIGALGQLGPIGLALIILVVMWFLNRQTASQYRAQIIAYREEITRLNRDHDEEIADLRRRQAEDLADLREQIAQLKDEVRGLRADMQTETKLRREAEEKAHQAMIRGRVSE